MFRILLTLLFVWCLCSPVSADIYKYTDENGVTCYTDIPNKKSNRVHKDATNSPSSQKKTSQKDTSNIDFQDIVHQTASNYDIDPTLIKAVIQTESNWNDRAISKKGAIGLMQLMPGTAVDMDVLNPFDPEENIEGGTKYLRYLLERFNGDLTLALAAYNAGPSTVERYGYVPPITETKQYVKKVLSLYNGKTPYSNNKKGTEPIYKIVLDDGSVLFTNSSEFTKNVARF
jgi:soluble lytic murein transglycosylase-like protein